MSLVGIRRGEWDRFREDVNRRLERLEREVESLETEHETDMDELSRDKRDGRRWTWQQIVAAAAAAATVGGFWFEARGR